jgi:C4-dicarboxylate transporter, DctM subunit
MSMDILIALLLVIGLFALLGAGLWIGLALLAVALAAMHLLVPGATGDRVISTMWSASSPLMLTALPLFLWMGEILFRTKLSDSMFRGLAPWLQNVPGRLLHTNVVGCTIFAAVSGSSAATCAMVGKMTLPELQRRGYPDEVSIGTLAGSGTLGLLIPPSIIMIVYCVATNESISKMFLAGIIPGLVLAALFSAYIIYWSLRNPQQIPAADRSMSFKQKLVNSRHLLPVAVLVLGVLGSMYFNWATATETAAVGVAGAFIFSAIEGSLTWKSFRDGLIAACRVYCMIGLILVAAAALTLAMGFIGLPRHLAEFVNGLQLSQFTLLMVLMVFFIILGCFLDGISMVVLTISILMPTVKAANIDMLWFGIFIVLVVEMAQITPPVGFNLFVLQGMTKRSIGYIAKAALPMFFAMVVAVLLIYTFPQLVLWLPSNMKN